ncbi:branched-chain amino acid ABC transporter permease [Nakamurella sp. YIM 132087]|uniref:Branched-chain amino acid ABC transporter permease n=1 Tax=Nakamurella alba TaxID=2665158 RepID=A0A7K1FH08_9ACTN|nr:branched-chain amino acid ABC transporter permease [Nakamurella alba]MTD13417.1 branched-chain amino acid ABC transporter permease [Nakamurella alba]
MIQWFDANIILIQTTAVSIVLALSVQFPMRCGVFSFGGIGAFGLGAYTGALLIIHQDVSPFLAVAAATLVGAVVSLALGVLVQRLRGLYLAMSTVAFCLIITVLATNGGTLTGGANGLFGVITTFGVVEMWSLVVVVVALVAATEHGKLARRIAVVRDDPELASSIGISNGFYRLLAFGVSGALGGCAGTLSVLVRTTVSPAEIGFPLVVLALTMIIVGGARSWKGAVIGAVIFTWLPEILTFVGEWQAVIYGFVVAIAVIWFPRGIYGLFVDAALRRGQRRRAATTAPAALADAAGDAAVPQLVPDQAGEK